MTHTLPRHASIKVSALALGTLALVAASGCKNSSTVTSTPKTHASTPGTAIAVVLPADIDRLTGPTWHGTLTYLDYTSKKNTVIPSGMLMERSATNRSSSAGTQWNFAVSYDDEPHANSASPFVLSADGQMLDGEIVLERRTLPDGSVRIVTEATGEDDNKPAQIKHVLTISDKACSRQKLVKFQSQSEFFERHIYSWTR
jgi:hypothetical protein